MIKRTTLFLLLAVSASLAFGQENAIKIGATNLLTPFPRTASFGYERVLTDNMSVNTTLGMLFPAANAGILSTDEGATFLGTSRLNGWNLTPELRFYPGKKGAPYGFYFGPYLRYNTFSVSLDGNFSESLTGENYSVDGDFTGRLNFHSAGMQLGAQWLINEQFVIDWYFLGLGVSLTTISAKFAPDSGTFDTEAVEAVLGAYVGDLPALDGENLEFLEEIDQVKVRTPIFPFLSFRTGVSLGYAF